MIRLNYTALTCALLVLLAGCGAASTRSVDLGADKAGGPTPFQLESALNSEFARLGLNPARMAAEAPQGQDNAVFNLHGQLIDPDGPGGTDPTGVSLTWIERCSGDYDMNGVVGVSDLTPIGLFFQDSVSYDDAEEHGGFAAWPSGDPQGEGAGNWRLARVDGNADATVSLQDLTSIAVHFNQRLHGYRVYRRFEGETGFTLLANPLDEDSPLTVPRPGSSEIDLTGAVDYNFSDDFGLGHGSGTVEYYVCAYDEVNSSEGSESWHILVDLGAVQTNQPPTAVIEADPALTTVGQLINLNASASTDDTGILQYEWDLDGNGSFETNSGTDPLNSISMAQLGDYTISVRVTDGGDLTDTASTQISIVEALPPTFDISGTVTDEFSGGLEGIELNLAGDDTGLITVTSDSNGDFVFTDLPAGQYLIVAASEGLQFAPAVAEVSLIDSDVNGVNFTGSVELSTGATISGSVKRLLADWNDIFAETPVTEPMPGVRVLALDSDNVTVLGMDVTDANGNYTLNVPAQDFGIYLRPHSDDVSELVSPFNDSFIIPVLDGDTLTDRDFIDRNGHNVAGQ